VTDPFAEVVPILREHLKKDGLVAVWITNKASVRSRTITLLRQSGLTLFEEWVWLKTTVQGEPESALSGLWRKPYEVLLFFRRHRAHDKVIPKRRIIVGVPDLHSRKPCLKELIEAVFGLVDYQALEVFARHLVTGWWSWGDEVLKFAQILGELQTWNTISQSRSGNLGLP